MLQFVNGHIRQFIMVYPLFASTLTIKMTIVDINNTSYKKFSMFESFVS